ncbi:hypothetical protein M9Y10_034812 [Tritrichomonas musculus]|uniref:Uncharacterized protein n=1 Tax=Tritrichomonas musculus TaxID=1915356 RepID=A0ABR2KGG3_9EUKA
MNYLHSATLRFDFKTAKHAQIAANTLNVDDDLKPEESTSEFLVEDNFLVFNIKAATPKNLKKTINTTIPSIMLIEKTINEFALD